MLAAYATKVRIVTKEIRELGALLHQVDVREAADLLAKVWRANEFAEDNAGVIEAQGLVEVAGDEIVTGRCSSHGRMDSSGV